MATQDDISNLLERLSRLHANQAHASGLRPPQAEVLKYLARANRFSCNPTAVKTYLGLTKGTVSQTLMALEKRGLISKEKEQEDKRNVLLTLTPHGASLATQQSDDVFDAALGEITRADTETLRRLLENLLANALEKAGGKPFGMCQTCRFFCKDDPEGAPHRCGLLNVPLSDEDSGKICMEHEATG